VSTVIVSLVDGEWWIKFMAFEHEYIIQFRDTDAAGVVYFANIISICHVAYEASLIESGIDLKLFMNNPKFAVPITHVSADFFRPLFCGDRVITKLIPHAIDICKFEIEYQIMTTDRQRSATAITKHIAIDPTNRKRKELPTNLIDWIVRWS
jgi:1,4-dihydroxy-2-naphthoyl-CoA hydrolase